MAWARIPFLLYLIAAAGAAMLPVALLAWIDGDDKIAWSFAAAALVTFTTAGIAALAVMNRPQVLEERQNLLGLLAAMILLPYALAWPLVAAVPDLRPSDAYFEMVSSITTTGLTLSPIPGTGVEIWPRSLHLWRALIAWLGGLCMWVSAVAVLAPLHIGGAELVLRSPRDQRRDIRGGRQRDLSPADRIWRSFEALWGTYLSLTFTLWLLLLFAGEMPFIAACHAMSVIATSGISPVGGLQNGAAGTPGELIVFAFFIFALSRRVFARDLPGLGRPGLVYDPELRASVALIVMVTVVLFMRHWIALVETAEAVGLFLLPQAVWGAVFTSASFLSTTGFVSEHWEIARLWSGLSTPGMVLMGLALMGGGVATTAGGVKLLRIYVLYKHGQREVSRLVHPSTVGGIGTRSRPVRQEAAFMAWLMFMMVAMSITLTMLALSFAGLDFEPATVLTIAAISNTGPLMETAPRLPIQIQDLSELAKLILCGAMVLGRLETLAIVALLNPDFWRR